MTTPGGNAPDGAYVIGTKFGSDETETGIRNKIRGNALGGFAGAQSGFGALFADIAGWIANFNAVLDEQVTNAGEITEGLTDLENRVELLEGGAVTVRTYAFNSVWTKPPGLIRLGVAVEGGGHAGRSGSTVTAFTGGTGGLSGGYRYQWFELASIENDIGATEEIVIGGGGEIPSQLGGVSRFGTHLLSVAGIGAVLSVEGAVVSNSASERGGNGGLGTDGGGRLPSGGEAGGSSAFAAGGAGGSTGGTRAGSNGQDAVISPVARGNGGGGGGGGGAQLAGSVGGKGGDGGFPAGPGGGGGARGHGIGSSDGAGGLGADGRVTVIEYTRPQE